MTESLLEAYREQRRRINTRLAEVSRDLTQRMMFAAGVEWPARRHRLCLTMSDETIYLSGSSVLRTRVPEYLLKVLMDPTLGLAHHDYCKALDHIARTVLDAVQVSARGALEGGLAYAWKLEGRLRDLAFEPPTIEALRRRETELGDAPQ